MRLDTAEGQTFIDEWNRDADFQDRYSRDYIRAESTGRQSGKVPFLLTLISGPDEKRNAWAKQTNAGVTLTPGPSAYLSAPLPLTIGNSPSTIAALCVGAERLSRL